MTIETILNSDMSVAYITDCATSPVKPYSAGVLHSVADQIQNLQNCFTTPNKVTSKDDIKGLVSLKFLRPWTGLRACAGIFKQSMRLGTD
jgi:hypothetical protein